MLHTGHYLLIPKWLSLCFTYEGFWDLTTISWYFNCGNVFDIFLLVEFYGTIGFLRNGFPWTWKQPSFLTPKWKFCSSLAMHCWKYALPAPIPSSTWMPTTPWMELSLWLGRTKETWVQRRNTKPIFNKEVFNFFVPKEGCIYQTIGTFEEFTTLPWVSVPSVVSSPLVVPYPRYGPSCRLPLKKAVWISKDRSGHRAEAAYWRTNIRESYPWWVHPEIKFQYEDLQIQGLLDRALGLYWVLLGFPDH